MLAFTCNEVDVPSLVQCPEPNAILGVQWLQPHRDDGLRCCQFNAISIGRRVRAEPAALLRDDHGVLREQDENKLVERLEVGGVRLVHCVVKLIVDVWEEMVPLEV